MITTTKDQRKALKRIYLRRLGDTNLANVHRHGGHTLPVTPNLTGYRALRKLVQPGPGCIMVPYAGMWLGIEPDGYTHS